MPLCTMVSNQEQILSRLAALENRDQVSPVGRPAWYSQSESFYDTEAAGDFSFNSVGEDSHMLPPAYIPPPPMQHLQPPPRGCHPPSPWDPHPPRNPHPPPPQSPATWDPHPPLAPRNPQPPQSPATRDPHPTLPPRNPQPPHSPPAHTPPSHPPPHVRAPFRQLYPSNASMGHSGRTSRSAACNALPSCAINRKKLVSPKVVIQNNQKLMCAKVRCQL